VFLCGRWYWRRASFRRRS